MKRVISAEIGDLSIYEVVDLPGSQGFRPKSLRTSFVLIQPQITQEGLFPRKYYLAGRFSMNAWCDEID